MSDAYETFMDVLLARAVELLSEPESPAGAASHPSGSRSLADPECTGEGPEVNDSTYALTLTAWIVHFLQAADDPVVTEGVVKSCLMTPSPGYATALFLPNPMLTIRPPTHSTLSLLDALVKADPSLAESVRPLVNVLRNSDSGLVSPHSCAEPPRSELLTSPPLSQASSLTPDAAAAKLDEMEARLRQFEARLQVCQTLDHIVYLFQLTHSTRREGARRRNLPRRPSPSPGRRPRTGGRSRTGSRVRSGCCPQGGSRRSTSHRGWSSCNGARR